MNVWEVIVIVILAQSALHYFPWRALLKGREIPRLGAYTVGLLGVMGPFTAWLWSQGMVECIQMLWMVIGSAGMTVFALYGLDRYMELSMRDMEAGEREHAGKKTR